MKRYDYVVGPKGTHRTLFGPNGALASAVNCSILVTEGHREIVRKDQER